MATPDVNKTLLAELEEMGFSKARATKALQFSGNSSIEDAINWLVDHENDADVDEMPMVHVDIPIESPDSPGSSEPVNLRLQQLREQVRKNRDEEQKKLERNMEKERIKSGKELVKAKRMAEESERKRYIAKLEADKEEKRRAMERIRQKLQQDKAERRGRIGLPGEDNASAKPAESLLHNRKDPMAVDHGSVPVVSSRKGSGDLMRECLRSLKRQNMENDAQVKRAFQTLLIYVRNITTNPEEEKYRKIRIGNPAFQSKVGRFKEGIKFLELCGFEKIGEFIVLPREKVDMNILAEAAASLHSALTNPYFGLLSRNSVEDIE
ncbi:OLC1v1006767C2 [Oldenlandia corymbosa var. corymbosa]|uniref:OLC1v1006767C2 n=1 Tax=Oldenlandia corymbosa var. corymbosa TaxID=529605 RepID=A0AAV1DKU0_OLDCO|nr:OLC1v1006767C2 [Oldenlandia corymbosa var. corymbosa]